jgi:hypothetical protein
MPYVTPADVNVGDVIAPGGMFAARGIVVEIREPSHALAAYHGAIVVDVDYGNGHRPRPVTLWPDLPVWRDEPEA